jgi:segregation and condensation protein B
MISDKTIEEIDNAKELENLKKIEAVLFIAGRFLSIQEIVSLTDINPILLRQLLEKLIEKYEDSAIEIIKRGDLWKMDVKQQYSEIVNRLATGNAEFSKAEQETLAIIAYKQPVKQSVIIKIRGNKAYEHVKKFREIGLVKTKRLGHTLELNLSDEFYDYFKIGKKEKDEEDYDETSGEGQIPNKITEVPGSIKEGKIEEVKEEVIDQKNEENIKQK